ncbi:copper amine oxidase N-terminal domain-containing protein [Paenibacillus solisilvae]|uniref:Copper amine oxidase N-terminal domain-containing protein n=1 Tax=Paenibacillus solisilvae TaxID=2486751 RepID=A0ABW0W2P0_9BACL
MKKWKWSKKAVCLLLLSVMLIVVAGCQAVGGIDFNQMLKQAVKVTSFEGNETMEFKLLLKEDALEDISAEEAELLDLISNIKLQLSSMKVSSEGQMSMNGQLDLGAKSIGFSLKMNDELAIVELDGAKSPFILHLKELADPADTDSEENTADQAAAEQSLVEAGHQLMDTVGGYVINNLPNPTGLSVKAGQVTVGGETVNGMHIQAEMNGKQIWSWFKSFIDALITDKEGLKSMLSGLFDIIQSQSDLASSAGGESIFGSIPEEDQKADAINEAADSLTEMLTQLKTEMTKAEKEDQATIDQIFNEQTYVKADMFVDGKLDIRKSTVEAMIKPQFAAAEASSKEENAEDWESDVEDFGYADVIEQSPIEGIWMKMTTEMSNVNGTVTPEAPVETKNAIDAEALFNMEGYQMLRQFDSDSVVYGILCNQAHITRQSVTYYSGERQSEIIHTPSGVTLIPLRQTAESFGAILTKLPQPGTISVYDDATSSTIILKMNSNAAVVDGKTVKWAFPTTVIRGVTYVPVRDFAKAIGGNVSWEKLYGNSSMLSITREP